MGIYVRPLLRIAQIVVAAQHQAPGPLLDIVGYPAHAAVRHAGVDPIGMPAAGLCLPVPARGPAPHTVPHANAGIPELVATLNVVGSFPAVVGSGAIPNRVGRRHAATRKAHRPNAAVVERSHSLPDFVEKN